MKLNSLKLSPAAIPALYGKNLIGTNDPQPYKKDAEPGKNETVATTLPGSKAIEIRFLGENRKNILVVVDYDTVSFLPDEDLSFLVNMLTACKLSIADTAIINLKNITDPSYKTIFNNFNSSTILLFGPEPSALSLPVSFPHFQVQAFNNYTFLSAPLLGEIRDDKVLKSKLWVCLRRIFNV